MWHLLDARGDFSKPIVSALFLVVVLWVIRRFTATSIIEGALKVLGHKSEIAVYEIGNNRNGE